MKERVQKLMAQANIGSRRACETLIEQGRVRVNGTIATLGDKADPTTDVIEVDGNRLRFDARRIYFAFNKPKQVLVTSKPHEDDERPTALSFIPYEGHLFTIGRLDADSEGLVILTNDGELAQRLTHPRFRHTKTYRVTVQGLPTADTIQKWREGVFLDEIEGRTAPCLVEIVKGGDRESVLRIVMTEGKKRQIRRVGTTLGHRVTRLVRTQVGMLELGNLREGEYRELSADEVERMSTPLPEFKTYWAQLARERRERGGFRPDDRGDADRAARPPRRDGDSRPPRRDGDSRPPRPYGERSGGEGRPPRPYGERSGGEGRPPRRDGDSRPPRPYGERSGGEGRPPRRDGDSRPPRLYGERSGGEGRPPRRDGDSRPPRPYGERSGGEGRPPRRDGDSRPPRPYGERSGGEGRPPRRDGDSRPPRPYGERSGGEGRPPRRDGDSRPPRPYGERSGGEGRPPRRDGDSRPPRPYGERSGGEGRPPRRDGDSRPPRPYGERSGGEGRPPRRDGDSRPPRPAGGTGAGRPPRRDGGSGRPSAPRPYTGKQPGSTGPATPRPRRYEDEE